MATIYCDFYNGSDGNDGLTTSTPKLSLNAATALVTAQSDVVKLRGWDDWYTELTGGTITWTYGIATITGSTDLGLSVGDFIFKSTDTYPDIYKVSSENWDGGTYTVGLAYTRGTFQGTSETGNLKRLNLPSVTAAQTSNKNGYMIGANVYNQRTGTTISGGWDSGYIDNIDGYTVSYNSAQSGTAFGIGNQYWDLSQTLVVGWQYAYNFTNAYNRTENLIATNHLNINSYPYSMMSHTRFNQSGGGKTEIGLCHIVDMWSRGGYWAFTHKSNQYAVHLIDCEFSNATLYTEIGTSIVSGCTFNTEHSTAIVTRNTGMKCYYNTFNNTGQILYEYNHWVDFVGNTSIYKVSTGNNGVKNNNGYTSLPNEKFLNQGVQVTIQEENVNSFTVPTGKIFDDSAVYLDNALYDSVINPDNHIDVFLQDSINNMFIYNTASVQTYLGDFYTGDTSLKITQHNASYDACAGTIEFFVQTGTTYNLSFYAKSSAASLTLNHNFYQSGMYLLSPWESDSIDNSSWTNITSTLSSSDLLCSGVVKLFVDFDTTSGGYVLLDKIEIT